MDLRHLFYVDGLRDIQLALWFWFGSNWNVFGQLTYFYGQRYLVGVGDFIGESSHPDNKLIKHKLTS